MNGVSPISSNSFRSVDLASKNTNWERQQLKHEENKTLFKDHFERSGVYSTEEDKTNIRSEQDLKTLNAAIEQSQKTVAAFKEMVRNLLYKQAAIETGRPQYITTAELIAIGVPKAAAKEIERLSLIYGSVDAKSAAMGEEEYWGVSATAQRIFDFALAVSGGDNQTFESMREHIHKAFEECERLWGGRLPDISYQTLEKIDSLFDEHLGPSSIDTKV